MSFARTAYLELAALELALALDHFGHLSELPLHHHDPFDRLLLAQARSESLYLATADGVFDAYAEAGVSVLRCGSARRTVTVPVEQALAAMQSGQIVGFA